jgi:ATP-dependent DNA helicase RecG
MEMNSIARTFAPADSSNSSANMAGAPPPRKQSGVDASVDASPLADLTGIGAARVRQLAALGVHTRTDLLDYLPRYYRYESNEKPISQLVPEQIQIARGEVIAVDQVFSRPRPRFEVTLDDGTEKLDLVFFNGGYLRGRIRPGMLLRAQGMIKLYRNQLQMVNPRWQEITADAATIDESRFRPIYPASGQLPSDAIQQMIERNLEALLPEAPELFSSALLRKNKLMSRDEAYRLIHLPKDEDQAKKARRRLAYDELMLMQIGLAIGKRLRHGKLVAPILQIDKLLNDRICARFPFQLTEAQRAAIWEISADLQRSEPMNRLLQGDVGSGKTVVAAYAMLTAVANKMQTALLAPTEVLAEQHFLTLSNLLRDSKVKIALFTGRTMRQGGKALMDLANGKIHIAVGTQALLGQRIEFARLGLVVMDEQHKLGVRQRAALQSKGISPHSLVMTATPIPRTLALSYFADFDLSTIHELPPGRQPIATRWVRRSEANYAYEFIRREVAMKRQAYIVLPQIDKDGESDVKSVRGEFDRLVAGPLKGLRLVMLHGQMPTKQKQEVMLAMRDRRADVLVSTTVIEVGIDLPNATVMLIDNADRFGLSQLHQLRGRVGRGSVASTCLLLADTTSEIAQQRLNSMTESGNGFEIAEMDLKLRGPGEFFGTRQHGLPEFKLLDVTQELQMLADARDEAVKLVTADPRLTSPANRALRAAIIEKFGNTLPLGSVQ